jgi:hypothetical protein
MAETIPFGTSPTVQDHAFDGCNPSISHHENDSAVRVMYLDSSHRGLHICNVRNQNRSHMSWNDQENPYLDEPEWSTHNGFASCKASAAIVEPPFDLYLIRISDGASLKVLEGNNSFPHLWIKSNSVGIRSIENENPKRAKYGIDYCARRLRNTMDTRTGRLDVYDVRGRMVTSSGKASEEPAAIHPKHNTCTVVVSTVGGHMLHRHVMAIR